LPSVCWRHSITASLTKLWLTMRARYIGVRQPKIGYSSRSSHTTFSVPNSAINELDQGCKMCHERSPGLSRCPIFAVWPIAPLKPFRWLATGPELVPRVRNPKSPDRGNASLSSCRTLQTMTASTANKAKISRKPVIILESFIRTTFEPTRRLGLGQPGPCHWARRQ
jgi:hypothetical protein